MDNQKVSIKTIDDYLAVQKEPEMLALENIRQIVHDIAPEAVEVISYNMPAFKIYGRILIYFAAFKKHCSIFVGNASLIKELKNELKSYKTAPGTIQFTVDKPLPKTLIKKIIKLRVKENLQKSKLKK